MEYAGFWRRAVAAIIDGFLLGFLQAIIMVAVIAAMTFGESSEQTAVILTVALNLAMFVAMWLYFALMESSKLQATIGKMIIGVVVSDLDGNRISFGRATGRYFGKAVSTVILMIGYMMAGWTGRKQALHDIMAKCLVIRKPRAA
ncbi:MAG: RDD family protein [Proteobacteria bacterium]|nr:RDD family protein [Pseudomonadota bacterium]